MTDRGPLIPIWLDRRPVRKAESAPNQWIEDVRKLFYGIPEPIPETRRQSRLIRKLNARRIEEQRNALQNAKKRA